MNKKFKWYDDEEGALSPFVGELLHFTPDGVQAAMLCYEDGRIHIVLTAKLRCLNHLNYLELNPEELEMITIIRDTLLRGGTDSRQGGIDSLYTMLFDKFVTRSETTQSYHEVRSALAQALNKCINVGSNET